MQTRTFALVVLASGWLVPPSAAGQELSRGAAIARALQQNPQLAAARAGEAGAQARQAQALSARLPRVTFTAVAGPALKAKLAPGTAVGSTESAYGDLSADDLSLFVGGRLEALQPLYTFGKLGERVRAAGLELEARRAQTQMSRAEVAVSVARLYEALLLARDVERFIDDTVLWLTRTLEHTKEELASGGTVTEQDVLRLESGLGLLQLGKHQASAGCAQARAGLAAYLAYPEGAQLEPREPQLELLPFRAQDARALSALGLRERPELRALSFGSAALGALAAAEQADQLPDVFALGFVSAAYTPGRDWIESRFVVDELNHFVPGVLLGARWAISGSLGSERAAETRARASELEHTRQWAELAVPAEVTKALTDVVRAQQEADDAERAAVSAKQWLVRAGADFAAGIGDSRAVSDAADALGRLRLATFDAKFRHNVALAELARATGTLSTGESPFYPTR